MDNAPRRRMEKNRLKVSDAFYCAGMCFMIFFFHSLIHRYTQRARTFLMSYEIGSSNFSACALDLEAKCARRMYARDWHQLLAFGCCNILQEKMNKQRAEFYFIKCVSIGINFELTAL